MNRFPDFGQELRRPFEVHENCYDCAGFYDGCRAWPAAKAFACRIVQLLPDVPAGTCGQRFPATSRKLASVPAGSELEGQPGPVEHQTVKSEPSPTPEPEGDAPAPVESTPRIRPAHPPEQTRRPSPTANRGPNGERLCQCGGLLPKRKRCCHTCRRERREDTIRRRMSPERLCTAVDGGSGVPFTGPGTRPTQAGSGAHS